MLRLNKGAKEQGEAAAMRAVEEVGKRVAVEKVAEEKGAAAEKRAAKEVEERVAVDMAVAVFAARSAGQPGPPSHRQHALAV